MNYNCNNNQNCCCSNTCHCQPEPCCCIGPTGPAGPQGATGATGPTGPAGGFEPAYGTFIRTAQTNLAENELVSFDNVLSDQPVGITLNPGSTTVTVLNGGVYMIIFELISNSPATFALVINGAVLPNSRFHSEGHNTSTAGTAMVTLAAGSTLGIISIYGTILSGLPDQPNAALTVLRIS